MSCRKIPPYCICFVILWLSVQAQNSSPEQLHDGVLVVESGATRSHEATWHLVITLDVPEEEASLRQRLISLRHLIHSINSTTAVDHARVQNWDLQLDDIEKTMIPFVPGGAHRTRRGLFNFLGEVSNKLFGTATEKQVRDCELIIEQFREENKKVVHVTNELVSIVNQSHNQITENRKHIREIENYLARIALFVERQQATLNQHTVEINDLDIQIQIDRTINSLTSVHNFWLRKEDQYRRQRAALDLGHLTEDLLPLNELRVILTKATRKGFYHAHTRWYYENVVIEPMWSDARKIVFRADLPLTSDETYIRYRITTWPVFHNTTGLWVQISTPSDVAFHTTTGALFEPKDCIGANPAICRTGPLFERNVLDCPRGLLQGNKMLHKKCPLNIHKNNVNATIVSEISPGTLVVSTTGETLSLLCNGQPVERIPLHTGAFSLRVKETCVVKGDGWSATGLVERNSAFHLELDIISIPVVNITRFLSLTLC